MNGEDRTEVKKGNIGEDLIDEFLLKKNIIPYISISKTAHPFDRLCITKNKKKLIIAEVKTKPKRIYYEDTGFNLKHYEDYKFIRDKYNIPVFIFFVDEYLEKIYGNYLNVLSKKYKKYPKIENNIIYFHLDSMRNIMKLTKENVEKLKKLTTRNYNYEVVPA